MSETRVYVVREWQADGYSELVGVFTDLDAACAIARNAPHRSVDAAQLDQEDAGEPVDV